MAADFETLHRFLRRSAPPPPPFAPADDAGEVGGRSREAPPPTSPRELPPPDVEARLQHFARGESTPAERDELCAWLDQHPSWLSRLGEIARGLTPPSGSAAADR